MSDSPSRLNLIQRAMQQGSFSRSTVTEKEPATDTQVIERGTPSTPVEVGSPQRRDTSSTGAAGSSHYMPQEAVTARRDRDTGHNIRLNLANLKEGRISTPENRGSVTYNEFRAIKRKLIPLARDESTGQLTRNVIMVTSAMPGEGKTFTVMNMAIGLAAERNLEVILIDGDIVRGTLSRYFSDAPDEGLVDLLGDDSLSLDNVLCHCTDLPSLHVLFSGKRNDHGPELLASMRMKDVMAAVARRYPQSIIVVDAPPILVTSEPVALAMHVDHVLLLIAAGRTTRHQVTEALGELSACQSVNLLFNKSPQWQRPAGNGYYYGYGTS